jgi:carboxymethylenebutenolidase
MNIRTEKLSLTVDGAAAPMPTYLAAPEGGGPHPAVIIIEEIFGINSHMREVTERVAREGYVAVAPEIHHRAAPGGLELGYDAEGMQKGMALIPKLTESGFVADMNATMAALRARKDVKGDHFGCMGFCIGGHLAYLAACVSSDIAATASFYGGGIATFSPAGGKPTVERTGSIRGRILCLFGAEDPLIPQAQVDQIRKALEQHKIRHEVVVYPGASHAFFCDRPERHSYNADAATDSWRRVTQLFTEELRK